MVKINARSYANANILGNCHYKKKKTKQREKTGQHTRQLHLAYPTYQTREREEKKMIILKRKKKKTNENQIEW